LSSFTLEGFTDTARLLDGVLDPRSFVPGALALGSRGTLGHLSSCPGRFFTIRSTYLAREIRPAGGLGPVPMTFFWSNTHPEDGVPGRIDVQAGPWHELARSDCEGLQSALWRWEGSLAPWGQPRDPDAIYPLITEEFIGPLEYVVSNWDYFYTPSRDAEVTFRVQNALTTWGTSVLVAGSMPALGQWDPARALALDPAGYPDWVGSVGLTRGTVVEFKFIKRGPGGVVWESGANHILAVPDATQASFTSTWR
jgi:hypothetical protein